MSIATYIKEDLAARLTSAEGQSVPLTLDALSDHYGVSFTPVRTAVEELIAEGVLEKGPNRRLKPSGKWNGRRSRKEIPEPPHDPFETIAHDLVWLSLKGEPVYLREEVTAETYGISRSAIRNTLHRLAGMGMLDHIPRRGWRVRPFRQEDMQAFLEVREVLELKALELARPHLVTEDLQSMLAGNVIPVSEEEFPSVDDSLHAYFVEKAGNAYIKEFFDRHSPYYAILFEWEDLNRQISLETARQHRDILTALLDKDWQAARKALSHHIRCNHPILSKIAPMADQRVKNHERVIGNCS
ncbi:MAG: GntR family transcriptional regulator [Planctomycetaceae bacterium]|nr:GntR family transcriptional regulator [Planctomycetaceae bacterium]